MRFPRHALVSALVLVAGVGAQPQTNLLLNAGFRFHCFDDSRAASAKVFSSGYVPGWNSGAYGDVTVTSAPHVDALGPATDAVNVAAIRPGKRLYQVIFLPDIGIRHGEQVSLSVRGRQSAPDSLRATVTVLKIDSQTGTWVPKELGMSDGREFPRHSRGELVAAESYSATSGPDEVFEASIEGCEVIGRFVHANESSDDQINSIALRVEFENVGEEDALVYRPCLVEGPAAMSGLPELRAMPEYYTRIPRTIRKLWRGEPLHILVMGSSIDRGSANPSMYLYDEDPASATFKQPIAQRDFDGALVGRPDLTETFGWWQHYSDWAGRLRVELMRKFDLAPEQLCLNFMARDGSSISEAMTGLEEYCSLALPPSPEVNGQPEGRSWEEMYPGLFDRPQGHGPDLVLFGSGANRKTDQPDEGAIFEATIRWIQARYPECEFLCCMWQRDRSYTPNTGHMMEIALNYGIPFIDLGDRMDQLLNYANRYALCPSDGHPQAAGHAIWFRTVEQAFEVADPIVAGVAQEHLPRRLNEYAYGWEGEIATHGADSPRIKGNLMILDDVQVTCWASPIEGDPAKALIDGVERRTPRPSGARALRNASFTYGRLSLGDRHVLELGAPGSKIVAADCRICPDRRFFPAGHALWQPAELEPEPFASEWGAPYGDRQVRLEPGSAMEIDAVCTDLSVAYVDSADGGTLAVTVDGEERLTIGTSVPFTDSAGNEHYMENRRGIRGLGYGIHRIRLEAGEAGVALLGLFTYDSRSNSDDERRLTGVAAPGETLRFTPPFGARPIVICEDGLTCDPADVTPDSATFGGGRAAAYQVIGE